MPASTLLDAYLGLAARAHPAYRADLRPGDAPAGQLPAGRALGWSPWLGPFTYRAKRFEELGAEEQAALLRDPAWRAFLAAAARKAHARSSAVVRISLEPSDMLARRPLVLRIDSPP